MPPPMPRLKRPSSSSWASAGAARIINASAASSGTQRFMEPPSVGFVVLVARDANTVLMSKSSPWHPARVARGSAAGQLVEPRQVGRAQPAGERPRRPEAHVAAVDPHHRQDLGGGSGEEDLV